MILANKDVLKDALLELVQKCKISFLFVSNCCFNKFSDLKKALNIIKKNDYDNLIAVTDFNFNPLRALCYKKMDL